jgi:hypothetical protein
MLVYHIVSTHKVFLQSLRPRAPSQNTFAAMHAPAYFRGFPHGFGYWVASLAGQSQVDTGKYRFSGTSAYHFQNTPASRLHLLRIPNHNFDYSVLPPLETYAQEDHVPGQSCPGHCPPTLHRITMNLCNVALRLLLHIVPTCVVRGIRGWGGLGKHGQSRTGASAQAAGLREGGFRVRPAASRREAASRAYPESPLERIPSGSAAEPYPRKSGRTKVLQLEVHVVLMGKVLPLGENHRQLCTGSSSGCAKLHMVTVSLCNCT